MTPADNPNAGRLGVVTAAMPTITSEMPPSPTSSVPLLLPEGPRL